MKLNPQVEHVIQQYPKVIQEKLMYIRQLIINTAQLLKTNDLEETLKWGEPSYLCQSGSTIRIAWQAKFPKQIGIYFNCKTILIENFKELFPSVFRYEGTRAIVFNSSDDIPINSLKKCISLALQYHKIKNLPLSKWMEAS